MKREKIACDGEFSDQRKRKRRIFMKINFSFYIKLVSENRLLAEEEKFPK